MTAFCGAMVVVVFDVEGIGFKRRMLSMLFSQVSLLLDTSSWLSFSSELVSIMHFSSLLLSSTSMSSSTTFASSLLVTSVVISTSIIFCDKRWLLAEESTSIVELVVLVLVVPAEVAPRLIVLPKKQLLLVRLLRRSRSLKRRQSLPSSKVSLSMKLPSLKSGFLLARGCGLRKFSLDYSLVVVARSELGRRCREMYGGWQAGISNCLSELSIELRGERFSSFMPPLSIRKSSGLGPMKHGAYSYSSLKFVANIVCFGFWLLHEFTSIL